MLFFQMLGVYALFASIIAFLYVYLFHVYYMPDTVKNGPYGVKIKTYIKLWVGVFAGAPYGLYEIIKLQKNGGFKK